jgi:hypothetical protein
MGLGDRATLVTDYSAPLRPEAADATDSVNQPGYAQTVATTKTPLARL